MAKKDKAKLNYAAETRLLESQGPQRLYLLYGPEDYLRECYLAELRKACDVSEEDFACRRLEGQGLDLNELAEAVDALPFFAAHSFVELRDYDLNKCREAEWERLKAIVSDVPDYCTLCFVQSASYELDGRTAAVKGLKSLGRALEFTEQEQAALSRWVMNRFRALGKGIAPADAEYLIFLSGARMNGLIPEIEKAASFAAGETVQRAEIDATATRVPEADVFAMTEAMARRRYDDAAALLRDLLADKNNHPIMLTALIGQQLRRMYAVKLGQAQGLDRAGLMELSGVRYDFLLDKLIAAARPYTQAQLGALVKLCAAYDFKMKSTGLEAEDLLRELFARIAAEG